MTKEEKIISVLGGLLLLYLLFRRNTNLELLGISSSSLIDSNTGIKIGYDGVSSDSHIIGEAVIPAGIPNDSTNAAFIFAATNKEISCPVGYEPIIDGMNHKVYCILQGYGSDTRQQETDSLRLYQQSQVEAAKYFDQAINS